MTQVLDDDTTSTAKWRAGTLTYSTAALLALFCWLLWGDFAWQMKERSAGPVVQVLLDRKYHASALVMGLFLMAIPSAIFMVLGPVVSYRSDRHRGPRGRRIPFILVSTPIAALAMVGIALSPRIGAALHASFNLAPAALNPLTICVLGVFWTIFELATVTGNSVFGGLVNDVVPRPVIGRFFGLFRAVSLGAGMIFNKWFIGKAEAHYVPIFLGVAAVYGIGVMMMCFKVKEGEYPPPPPRGQNDLPHFIAGARTFFRHCFSNRYYWWIFAAVALGVLAFIPVNLFSIPAAGQFQMSMDSYGNYVTLSYACSLLLAYPLGSLCDRFHALRMSIVTMAMYGVGMGLGYVYVGSPRSFGVFFFAHVVLSGSYFTVTAGLAQVLFPRHSFTQFAAAAAMISALINMLFGPALGHVLDLLHHDYRHIFIAASVISALATAALSITYAKFQMHGGPADYHPPECGE